MIKIYICFPLCVCSVSVWGSCPLVTVLRADDAGSLGLELRALYELPKGNTSLPREQYYSEHLCSPRNTVLKTMFIKMLKVFLKCLDQVWWFMPLTPALIPGLCNETVSQPNKPINQLTNQPNTQNIINKQQQHNRKHNEMK